MVLTIARLPNKQYCVVFIYFFTSTALHDKSSINQKNKFRFDVDHRVARIGDITVERVS